MKKIILILALSFLLVLSLVSAEITILHEFTGGVDNGMYPYGSLILDSGNLYSLTRHGGDSNYGTVFSIGTNGSGFSLLHEFASGVNDGGYPPGSLILDSGNLYGLTGWGGDYDNGTVFSIGTDGSDFSLLHEFAGGNTDGKEPRGRLILDSGKFYGITYAGGNSNNGTVFSMLTNGSDFSLLREFAGSNTDGSKPLNSLILDSGKLYGMTYAGGDYDYGTVFSMGTDGSGFSLLREFAGGVNDGKSPRGTLILDSGKLYGMTYAGGDSNYGTIFSMGTDGSGFSLLHEFVGGVNDGRSSYGSLILDSGKLYGMTYFGGYYDNGTVFSIGTDGSGFSLLHSFEGGVNDGKSPYSSLIMDLGKLYGMTLQGGDSNYGTIFYIQPGLPAYSNFKPHPETTNFSEETNLTDVKNLTLGVTDKGKIKFADDYGVNASGEDYDTNIVIENASISVNTSVLDSTFNSSASLTFYNIDCGSPLVYYSDTSTTRYNILAEDNQCLAPRCTNIQCVDSILTVDVLHFSGYAISGSVNLTIDADDPKLILEDVKFTAIYMNLTGGFITGATCNISFADGSYIMDEQADHYNYTKAFAAAQTVDYNVTCSKTGYNTVFANDTAIINDISIPEFSLLTLGIGLIAVLMGLVIIRRRR